MAGRRVRNGTDKCHALEDYMIIRNQRGFVGHCLIISNESFAAAFGIDDRRGNDEDRKILHRLFIDFHFEVEVIFDHPADDILTKLDEYKYLDHKDCSMFVCCILSHAMHGSILGSDGIEIPIMDITNKFSDKECSSLAGKPKMFFIQTCMAGSIMKENNLLAECRDMFMSYSSLPGAISYRSQKSGSYYVQALDKVLREHVADAEIDRVMKLVTAEVEMTTVAALGTSRRQSPFHIHAAVSKLLYLFPPSYD